MRRRYASNQKVTRFHLGKSESGARAIKSKCYWFRFHHSRSFLVMNHYSNKLKHRRIRRKTYLISYIVTHSKVFIGFLVWCNIQNVCTEKAFIPKKEMRKRHLDQTQTHRSHNQKRFWHFCIMWNSLKKMIREWITQKLNNKIVKMRQQFSFDYHHRKQRTIEIYACQLVMPTLNIRTNFKVFS